jgi:hypothetical protein
MKVLLVVLAGLILFGCSGPEKHIGTKKICDDKFYAEIWREWSEMGVCYLTDSTNFRIKIDRYNVESEYFEFLCKPDSLIINLWSSYPSPKHILKTQTFYLKKLIAEGKLKMQR